MTKKLLRLMATFAAFSMVAIACGPDEPDPTPTPTPGPDDPDKPVTEAPVADFTYEADGLNVQFTNTSTNATSYKWDFGDGTDSKEASPSHEYSAAGEYTVKLTAANAAGASAKKEITLTVAGKVEAFFSYEAKPFHAGKLGRLVAFDATTSANAASIAWDFGDGETSTEFQPEHEFADYGTYTVKATVTGIAGDVDVYEASVNVEPLLEMLQGGNMEEDDAKYWTYAVSSNYWSEDYAEKIEGVYSWQPYFGHKDTTPKGGIGGCLMLSSENQSHDYSCGFTMTQDIELEEGDVINLSGVIKWNENTNNNGQCNIKLKYPALNEDGTMGTKTVTLINFYTYWTEEAGGGKSIPPYDGSFEGDPDYIATIESDEEILSFGGAGFNNDNLTFTMPEGSTGTCTLSFTLSEVWSVRTYGPGSFYYLDNLSLKIVL